MKFFYVDSGLAKADEAVGFAVHADRTKAALRDAGVLVDRLEDADAAVWTGPPDWFKPTPGIKNVLFTAIEGDKYPASLVTSEMRAADLVLVPCSANQAVLKRILPRVEVCPLGVSPLDFPFFQRSEPRGDQPFRFLYVGNLHPSKGASKLIGAFRAWLATGSMPRNAELYIKTSNPARRNGRDFRGLSYEVAEGGTFRPSDTPSLPRITVDNRYLPVGELAGIYDSGHCFVLASYGEGWALTLPEALSTGCPAVWTGWGAMLDYGDDSIGYPLGPGEWRLEHFPWNPGSEARGTHVKIDALIRKMRKVYMTYPEALRRGRAASERMHSRFTWDQTARRFIEVCEQHIREAT